MMNNVLLFAFSFIVWMLLGWPFDAQHAFSGIFVSALIIFLVGDLFSGKPKYFMQPKRYFWFVVYVFFILWECLRANICVGLMVLNPACSIRPGIVRVRTSLKSATALAFLANSITLSPGAICVDIKPDKGILYVHWMNVKSDNTQETTQLLASRIEAMLKRIFE